MNLTLPNITVVAQIDLDYWATMPYSQAQQKLKDQLLAIHRAQYAEHERIVFTQTRDLMVVNNPRSLVLSNVLLTLNEVDISSFFVIVASTNPDIVNTMSIIADLANDLEPINVLPVPGEFDTVWLKKFPHSLKEEYQYGSSNPIKININQLSKRQQQLLTDSKSFCMYPWIHLHAWPTGQAFPCCMSTAAGQVGNCRTNTMKEIWNSPGQKQLRVNMLNNVLTPSCNNCYEQEKNGFFSGRQSANKHHGHHINRVTETQADGTLDKFEMTYWDIRFSNLCNLRCRSCGHIFSSQWFNDQAKIAGPKWKETHKVLNYAGRTETDMWEQLEPHLDYVEQVYFAGGEPLLMEEHYNILEELIRRGRTDVRLVYNTNFTHTDLKGRSVFEYWNQFESVSVGASLDDSGARGEYIRKGTDWNVVLQNRRDMLTICPSVDFYISPTLSIMNARHLPAFHCELVDQGLIRPQDLNVNILQDPLDYRVDLAPAEYKAELTALYRNHIEWLRGQDPLGRATQGFESAITFINATDNSHLIDSFWRKTHELDDIRKENILDVIPELKALK